MAKNYTKELLINEIWQDVVKGKMRYELKQKLDNDQYSFPTSNLCNQAKYNYINDAIANCKCELEGEFVAHRATILNRYLSVYQDAIDNSDRTNAIRVLDSVSKLMGLNEADKLDVKSDNTLKVNINFGTNNKEEENEIIEE